MSDRLAGDTYVFERRWLPSPDGSLTLRSSWTNVPRRVEGTSLFDWAGTGRGTYDLALNILEDTLRGACHAGPTAAHAGETCFTLSLILRESCVDRFISQIPDEGGMLPCGVVEAWITKQLGALDPLLAELLEPRFTSAEGHGPWTATELQAIRGEPLTQMPIEINVTSSNGSPFAAAVCPHPLDAAEWESCPL